MRKPLVAIAVSGALMVGGCASIMGDGRRLGSELVDRSVRREPAQVTQSCLLRTAQRVPGGRNA